MPVLTGMVLDRAQAGSLNPLLSIDGYQVAAIYPYTASDSPRAENGARSYATDITVPAQRALTGIQVPSYFEDYYFRVHLLPGRINLGSLASEQSRTIEVWNARLTPNTLASLTATGAEGMTLIGPAPAPTVFAANESRLYTLAVTPNGPPTVNATFLFAFAFDDAALLATGRRIVGWIFAPNWVQPVIERLEWLTDVMESHAGFEQRVRLRAGARRSFEYSALVGSDTERVKMENLLLSWQARVFGLPLWTDVALAAGPIPAGSTSIAVTTANRDFAVGGLVGLVLGMESEFAEITAVLPTSLTIKSPLDSTWPVGTKILPVRPARVQNDLGLTYLSDAIGQATLRFQFEDEWLLPAATETLDYRGYPVLLTATNWTEDVETDYARKLNELDFLTGRRVIDDLSGVGTVRRTHRWLISGRAAITAFRSWLAARAGRLTAFWMPSFQSDLKVVSPIGAFDSAITVENRAYAANVPAAIGRRDILIATTSGSRYYRRITGATALSPSTESIAIDSVVGAALLPEQIRHVSFMKLVRLDSDAIELAHHTDDMAEVSISVRSIRDDT